MTIAGRPSVEKTMTTGRIFVKAPLEMFIGDHIILNEKRYGNRRLLID